MQERIPADRGAGDEEADATQRTFTIEKAVVQSQDLEHQHTPKTRVSNKGVKVESTEASEVLAEPK